MLGMIAIMVAGGTRRLLALHVDDALMMIVMMVAVTARLTGGGGTEGCRNQRRPQGYLRYLAGRERPRPPLRWRSSPTTHRIPRIC